MSPDQPSDRWAEIDALFQRALEVPPAERPKLLAEAAPDDEELRESVEKLLASAESGSELFETPVDDVIDLGWGDLVDYLDAGEPPPASTAPPDRTGEVIGPYRLLRQVGRGGMATVYLAERADGQWEQQVAVKVIRRGLDTDDVIRRFLAERQILSSLEHPNIGRLLDGGSTDDGLPYLVLEFVEGEPLTAHCDHRMLSVRDRLRLFGDVCRAVQFAHRSLVVHRDLKPSNILVTADGTPKLLDFGIAKLLDDTSGSATATGHRRLTPQYASPELVRGEAITTASDVYQLGVLLCVLLSGRRPYDVRAASSAQMETQIADAAAERPSRLVTEESARARGVAPDRLRRRLTGDLDAIVLKALRKGPGERYASAESMLLDIDRHLAGHPVEAARGASLYRVGKFVRRHAVGLAATTVFFTMLTGATVAFAVQRDRAVAAAETSDRMVAFLSSVFGDADPLTGVGDTMSVRTQLARGARRVHSELESEPELQVELFLVIGSAYRGLGLLDEAVEILEVALDRARRAYGPHDEELEQALDALAGAHTDARAFELALPLNEEILEIRKARLGPEALEVALALSDLGGRVRDVIGPDSAIILLRQAQAVAELYPDSEDGLAISLNLAYVLRGQGELTEAEAIYREALPRYRELGPDAEALPIYLNNFAFLLRERGAFSEAAVLYQEAHLHHSNIYGSGHPTSLMLASNHSSALLLGGRTDEGEAVMLQRVNAARNQWPEGHWRFAEVLREQGMANVGWGDGLIAVAAFRESTEMYAQTQGERHPWTAAARAWLGAALLIIDSAAEGHDELVRATQDLQAAQADGSFDGRAAFQAREVAKWLEESGFAEEAVGLRGLLDD